MGAMRLCLLLTCLFFWGVSSVKNLKNTDDLKNVKYGRPAPRHGLKLLFWFAQRVMVDQNNICILQPNINLQRGDFGFHLFENREHILPSLRSEISYYIVGNLKYHGANALPNFVQRNYQNANVPERNMDRLIVSMNQNRPNRMNNLFITSHNRGRQDFNLSDTYEIDPELILQIRQLYDCTLDQTNNYINKPQEETEEERCSRFLIQNGYKSDDCTYISRRKKRSSNSQCNAYEGIKLQIKATNQGYLKLIYLNIPSKKYFTYAYINILQKTHSTNKSVWEKIIIPPSGALDTSVTLNAGLQPQLRLYSSFLNYVFQRPEVTWYGPEFDGANRVIPTRIKGFDASLQLYTEDGKACARLYIKKTFSNWKDVLYYSWVAFYKSSQDKNDGYSTYQYAYNFAKIENSITHNYDIYQYNSSLAIAPGVQIRFLLDKKYDKVLAQTTPWEGVEKFTILPSNCEEGNHGAKPSSPWSDPELFYGPEFYDANNVIPVKIEKYNAHLQLFTKDGKACARLYIEKTFRNWKDTFYYSWVGFYTSAQNSNNKYGEFQYAVKFEEIEYGIQNFDIYQYKSKLAIASGVQIRFLMDKSYDKKLAETEPWRSD